MPQFFEEARGAAPPSPRAFRGARGLLCVRPMRFFTLAVVAFAVACGSVSGSHDGGGGSGGAAGAGGAGAGGSGGVICTIGGVGHPAGTTFPSPDGCNSCTCTVDGQLACTERACPPDAGSDCAFDAVYGYGDIGGLVAWMAAVTLTPPASYIYERTSFVAGTASGSCAPALPACNATDLIDVADIMRDIADPDVQRALAAATPPTYGRDTRAVDGTVFQFLRGDGRGFLAGLPCGSVAGCTAIPVGVAQLVADLRALDTQQLKDASCAAVR
jgi:hypothetical protein